MDFRKINQINFHEAEDNVPCYFYDREEASTITATGRPPMFKTAEELETKISEYFKLCKVKPFLDDDGEPMTDKRGDARFQFPPIPPQSQRSQMSR